MVLCNSVFREHISRRADLHNTPVQQSIDYPVLLESLHLLNKGDTIGIRRLLSSNYNLLTTETILAWSLVPRTASGLRADPWAIGRPHPVGRRRIAPLGFESCGREHAKVATAQKLRPTNLLYTKSRVHNAKAEECTTLRIGRNIKIKIGGAGLPRN